jgi:hypothetical protein
MSKIILACLVILSSAVVLSSADRKWKDYAPLRAQIFTVKTVFLTGGPPAVLDKAYSELRKWGRFQVVADPAQADAIFEFRYAMARAPESTRVSVYDPDTGNTASGSATTPGVWTEFFTITDAKTKNVLYEDGRVASSPTGAVPVIVSAFRHSGMAQDMVKDLRKRIEATENASTFEYTIQLATKTAKLYADTSTLDERLAAMDHSANAEATAESLRELAKRFKELADQLSGTNAETAKYFADATEATLLNKHNVEQIEMYRDDTLRRGCATLEKQKKIARNMDAMRAELSEDVNRA